MKKHFYFVVFPIYILIMHPLVKMNLKEFRNIKLFMIIF
jgi:hypothetical protein